jgi:iron-sulfur cluster assembly accessory protein
MIMLTERAVNKVREIAEAEGLKPMVRLKLQGGGCSGTVRDIYFEENIGELDEVFEQDGVRVVVDQFSFQYLDETVLEYLETEMGGGFRFLNDTKATSSCGCGKSVSY